MKARADIKREARESLKGRRGLAVGALLLTALFTGLLAAIPYIGWLIGLLVGTIVTVGCYGLFVKIYRKQQSGIGELFAPFNRYGRVLGGSLWMYLWLVLWGLIFIIPIIIYSVTVALASFVGYGMSSSGVAMLWALPFFYLLMIPMIIKAYSYFCTQYILADCPDVPATKALDLSKKMMHGNKGKVFVAQLSFIGWYLLAAGIMVAVTLVAIAATAGVDGMPMNRYMEATYILGGSVGITVAWIVVWVVLLVFLAPYISTTMAGFYDEIKKDAIERGVVSAEDFGDPAMVTDGGVAQASYIAPGAAQQPVQQAPPVEQEAQQTAETVQQDVPPVETAAQQAEGAVKEEAPPAQPEEDEKKD